jgi:hypothetical protein
MIRFGVVDLVVVAAEVLDLDTEAVLDLLDLDAAERALVDPAPPLDDPAGRAGAMLYGLLHHRPLQRGNRRVALIATTQFLALNGWQLDLEPPQDLARVLLTADSPAVLATWVRRRLHRAGAGPKERSMFTRSAGTARTLKKFTERARRVVVLAQEEARMHGRDHIGTEHLLLGLLHEGRGVAAQALQSLGVDLDEVRRRVEEIGGHRRQAPSGHLPLNPEAKKALDLALREALQLGRPSVATEHILMGLIRNGEGVAAEVLRELGANLDEIRRQVLHLTESGPSPTAHLGELQRAKDAAIDAGDFRQAAVLRAQERELLPPDPGGETARLRQEVDRLRALLQEAGIDPEAGTPRTA